MKLYVVLLCFMFAAVFVKESAASGEEKAEAVPKEEAASEEEEEPTMLELEALEAIEEQMIEHMEGDFEEGDLDDQGKPVESKE
ncbi:hypothetical protein RRG08_055250 [Elysia crispata]|uniref:Uncharacterized protein n=1 Tax=Elysia crispata TaxID=231223 RepID=A0AAE0XUK7_9GAST|nr:hypothetical protein RRG08_055250 [Elysia crispata]